MMKAVIFDFNGTLFFDTCFHEEAWSKIYKEIRKTDQELDPAIFNGQSNDELIQFLAPELTKEERQEVSIRKEALYRDICKKIPKRYI